MATIKCLPEEVLEIILGYSEITIEDIIDFRYVCKQFREVAKGEKYCFLKKKFFQRWPTAKIYFDKQYKNNEQQKSEENEQKKHLNFIETGIDCVRQLQNCMFLDGLRLNYSEAIFRMRSFLTKDLKKGTCTTENNVKVLIFMDEIQQLLIQPPRVGCKLMDQRRYYKKLFDYLSSYWRKSILKTFEKQFDKNEFLEEEYAIILAQELQPGKKVLYSKVKESLNTIALKTLDFLYRIHPKHSIFSKLIDDKFLPYLENNNIDDNYWNEQEGTMIIDALEYLFAKLNFQRINSQKLEYLCIDYVLENKRGNDEILFIIFKCVARRLGILRCSYFHILTLPSILNSKLI